MKVVTLGMLFAFAKHIFFAALSRDSCSLDLLHFDYRFLLRDISCPPSFAFLISYIIFLEQSKWNLNLARLAKRVSYLVETRR